MVNYCVIPTLSSVTEKPLTMNIAPFIFRYLIFFGYSYKLEYF